MKIEYELSGIKKREVIGYFLERTFHFKRLLILCTLIVFVSGWRIQVDQGYIFVLILSIFLWLLLVTMIFVLEIWKVDRIWKRFCLQKELKGQLLIEGNRITLKENQKHIYNLDEYKRKNYKDYWIIYNRYGFLVIPDNKGMDISSVL